MLSDQAIGRRVAGSEFQKETMLRYAVPPPRPTDAYTNAGTLSLASFEASLDRLTQHIQQMQQQIDRCVKLPVTSSATVDTTIDPTLVATACVPAPAGIADALKLVRVDATGEFLEFVAP